MCINWKPKPPQQDRGTGGRLGGLRASRHMVTIRITGLRATTTCKLLRSFIRQAGRSEFEVMIERDIDSGKSLGTAIVSCEPDDCELIRRRLDYSIVQGNVLRATIESGNCRTTC